MIVRGDDAELVPPPMPADCLLDPEPDDAPDRLGFYPGRLTGGQTRQRRLKRIGLSDWEFYTWHTQRSQERRRLAR